MDAALHFLTCLLSYLLTQSSIDLMSLACHGCLLEQLASACLVAKLVSLCFLGRALDRFMPCTCYLLCLLVCCTFAALETEVAPLVALEGHGLGP
jgi:hypothetical protein